MRVHHLNIKCKHITRARQIFTGLYGFVEWGWLYLVDNELSRNTEVPIMKSYVMLKESIIIVLEENLSVQVDTIDNIAFYVDSVDEHCFNVNKYGGTVLEGPYFVDCVQRPFLRVDEKFHVPCSCGVSPCQNFIQQAVIESSVGNVKHTLLDKKRFKGDFLPGFVVTNIDAKNILTNGLSHIDHVALAVPCGETGKHIKWYENCLQMSRFRTNITENKSGLVIQGRNGNGLRMITLEEHPCSNEAVTSNMNQNEVELRNAHVKFVFVESLKDEGSDQVQIFLKHHSGPGVQHVAFYSKDITKSAQEWMSSGVSFIKPPVAYYNEIKTTLQKLKDSLDVCEISDIGILIDAEKHEGEESDEDGYLYQIFTEPVFDSRTFFFELIQRDNATGFGAGNVSALWRALDSRFQTLK